MISVFPSDAERLMHALRYKVSKNGFKLFAIRKLEKKLKLSSFPLFHFCDSLDGSVTGDSPLKDASIFLQNLVLAAAGFPGYDSSLVTC